MLSQIREEKLVEKSIEATPRYRSLMQGRAANKSLGAKARYLIRDTLKVAGHPESFPPPVAALFYVNLDNPEAGGTGHTIRVCRNSGIPYAFQDEWGSWPV